MNNFSKILAWLLDVHKQVVVPDLGAFILEPVPATLDRERQIIVPPRFIIRFDDRIQSGDNLLLDKYCTDTGKSLSESSTALHNQVTHIKNTLSSNGHYILEGLGVLHRDTSGSLYFVSYADTEVKGPFYGFQPIEIPPIISKKEPEAVKVNRQVNELVSVSATESSQYGTVEVVKSIETTIKASQPAHAHNTAADETKINTHSETDRNPFRFILWIICGLLLLALLAQIYFAPDILKNLFSSQSGETVINPSTDSSSLMATEINDSLSYTYSSETSIDTSHLADSLSYPISSETASGNNIISEPESSNELPDNQQPTAHAESVAKSEQSKNTIQTNEKAEKEGYCIILGTFSVQKNAEMLQKKIQKQGYEVLLLPMQKNKNKVCIFISGDISNAQKELPNFAGKFPDAIITKK